MPKTFRPANARRPDIKDVRRVGLGRHFRLSRWIAIDVSQFDNDDDEFLATARSAINNTLTRV